MILFLDIKIKETYFSVSFKKENSSFQSFTQQLEKTKPLGGQAGNVVYNHHQKTGYFLTTDN